MKKALATCIVLILVLSLCACGQSETTASPSAAADTAPSASVAASSPAASSPAASSTAESPDAAAATVEVGFFDPTIDYSKAENYKIAYIYSGSSALYDMFSKAFDTWAERLNCTYNDFSTSDADQYINTIQTYYDQGYSGLLLDPDATIYSRCADLLNELNMPWMGCMDAALDANGKLLHPSVGFDNYEFGNDMFQWCIDYAKKNWEDATIDNTGGLFIGFSVIPSIEVRRQGAEDNWLKNGYKDSNFYFQDGVTGQMDAQTAYDLASTTFSVHPEIKYWVACGFFDEYCAGIARAAEAAGKADQVISCSTGGTSLISQWDAGEESSWKAAVYTDQRLYAEPIICGLYAMMTGKASAETLWPEWVNKANGDTYASMQLPATLITKDMYKDYLSFVDQDTGIVLYEKYGITNPNTYPTSKEVPDSYKADT